MQILFELQRNRSSVERFRPETTVSIMSICCAMVLLQNHGGHTEQKNFSVRMSHFIFVPKITTLRIGCLLLVFFIPETCWQIGRQTVTLTSLNKVNFSCRKINILNEKPLTDYRLHLTNTFSLHVKTFLLLSIPTMVRYPSF